MIKNFTELIKIAQDQEVMKISVAVAQDIDVLTAVCNAAEKNIVEPILIGDTNKIKSLARKNNLDISSYEMISVDDLVEAANKAVELVSIGKADLLMKGLIDTGILLKSVLNKKNGLRTNSQLSHVMVYDLPTYHKLIYLTDGGMNIEPDFDSKIKIIKNAVEVAKAMGIRIIKVACLAAKEKVNPKMPATVDAFKLKKICESGEFGKGVIVEGPLALDIAVSKEAAKVKKFKSEIAGDTDILVVPNIEMGNGIGKTMTYFANGKSAGVIVGAKVPIVLVSRADSAEAKLNSIALGSIIASYKKGLQN